MRFVKIPLILIAIISQVGLFAQVEGGDVKLKFSSKTEVLGCSENDFRLRFTVVNTSTANTNYAYVVTNNEGGILGFPAGDLMDLREAPSGTCRVYGFSYTGQLDSTQTDINTLSSDGLYELSNNWITVYRDSPVDAAQITIEGQGNTLLAQMGDPSLNVQLSKTSNAPLFTFILSNQAGLALEFIETNSPSPSFDLSGADPGIFYIEGLAHTRPLLFPTSEYVSDIGTFGCYDWSSPSIKIEIIGEVQGGEVSTTNGEDEIRTCAGEDDLIFEMMNDSKASSTYAYVITDDNGGILNFPVSNQIDVSNAPSGVCRVYGVSYTGTLNVNAENIQTLSSDGDSEISDNWVTVRRDSVSSGEISVYGTDELTLFVGGDSLELGVSSTADGEFEVFYVTTENGEILESFSKTNVVDLREYPEGVCRIYSFVHTGNRNIYNFSSGGVFIDDIESSGCYMLSENWITITKVAPEIDGGSVFYEEFVGADLTSFVEDCVGGEYLNVTVIKTSRASSNYVYVITTDNGEILDFSTENKIDLTGAEEGVCRIYGFSYNGVLDETASTIDLLTSDGEYELSDNWVTVNRSNVDEGGVSLASQDGLSITAEKSSNNLIFDVSNSSTAPSYTYIVTEKNGDFISWQTSATIDLTDAPVGVCRVYGIAHRGELYPFGNVLLGFSAAGCARLSDNYITVTRTEEILGVQDSKLQALALNLFNVVNNEVILKEEVLSSTVYSTQGKRMFITNGFKSFDISSLSKGIYIIQLETKEGIVSTRFVR